MKKVIRFKALNESRHSATVLVPGLCLQYNKGAIVTAPEKTPGIFVCVSEESAKAHSVGGKFVVKVECFEKLPNPIQIFDPFREDFSLAFVQNNFSTLYNNIGDWTVPKGTEFYKSVKVLE